SVAYWNLGKLAAALLPLVENTDELEETLHFYETVFWDYYYKMMGNKLGLDQVEKEDASLISDFEKMLADTKPDMSIFYRLLIDVPLEFRKENELMDYFEPCFYKIPQGDEKRRFFDLIRSYSKRIKTNTISREDSQKIMRKNNPYFILRNYLLHQAIEELEKGENQLFKKLQQAMKTPYAENSPEFFKKRPEWAEKKAGCSMLSCSS
ncbi:MAG TPA: protein adenylyltransferase SelO family protein, partial [Salinimicrobium sp.]|nr:protein adenylyltransferase SelO family protein [Salinimicrobium sp.]